MGIGKTGAIPLRAQGNAFCPAKIQNFAPKRVAVSLKIWYDINSYLVIQER
jgi:hypothetical protein